MKENSATGKPVRVGILGATRGTDLVRKSWLPTECFNVAAVCDRNVPRSREALALLEQAGARDVKIFGDADEMLAWGKFDVVLVATPDETHAALAGKAFDAGYDCFIEKPMTIDVVSGQDLVARWRRSGKIGVAGHEYRYTEVMRSAKKHIDAGRIGRPILAVTMDSCGRMGSYWRRRAWRTSVRPKSKSLTLQKAIHQLDIQAFLMGERPVRVFASAGQNKFGGNYPSDQACEACRDSEACLYAGKNVANKRSLHEGLCVFSRDVNLHDNQAVVIDYENGTRGSYVECFFTPDYKFEHAIVGDKGRLVIRRGGDSARHELEITWIGSTKREEETFELAGGHGGGDEALASAFAGALRNRVQIQPDPAEGLNAVALASAIDRSAETGEPQVVIGVENHGKGK